MNTQVNSLARFTLVGTLLSLLLSVGAAAQEPTPRNGDYNIHIFPTVNRLAPVLPPSSLLYHGGLVMQSGVTAYAIFWVPTHLQTGGATSMTSHYQSVQKSMLTDYPGHGIDNNNTQYYEVVSTVKKFIQNKGTFGGSFIDTAAYPASGCVDPATPGACLTDAQLQDEITKVMGLKGWTGGLAKMFLLFTSSGEGSCFDGTGTSACAYTDYCAYHGFFGSTPVVYANEPFGDPFFCAVSGTPSPNSDLAADTAADSASHELTEAITDPELDAWFDASGNEIGDKCAFIFGTNTWDSAKANEMWNGHFYELQEEYDNHKGACVQIGP
jgi:hypothetical protein